MTPTEPPAALADPPTDPLSAAMDSRDRDVPALVADALAAGRVRLALQPVVTVDGGRVAFHEGLVRLLDDGGRILRAAEFLPTVADGALGREIDCASMDAGLRLLVRRPGLRLSVNMSARSIADAAWRRVLDRWLADHPDAAPRLILEMTEASAMLLPEITVRFMAEMQPKGVAFALDDFGAGAIALAHMKDFLFDLVKVDRRFGRSLDTSADDQVVVAALLSIARQFEMFTVIQGIESAAAADAARDLAADCLQGFHVGVPRLSP